MNSLRRSKRNDDNSKKSEDNPTTFDKIKRKLKTCESLNGGQLEA